MNQTLTMFSDLREAIFTGGTYIHTVQNSTGHGGGVCEIFGMLLTKKCPVFRFPITSQTNRSRSHAQLWRRRL